MVPPDHQAGVAVPVPHRLDHRSRQVHVRPGEDAQSDDVDVLLHRHDGDLLRTHVGAEVDHLEAGVAQPACHDGRARGVPVKPDLGDDDPAVMAAE